MNELEAAGLLETSTGLAVLSTLFLLAALHAWWSERRARRIRRAKLWAALEEGPFEPTAETPAAASPAEDEHDGQGDAALEEPSPDDEAEPQEEDRAARVAGELGLGEDDTAETAPPAAVASAPAEADPIDLVEPVEDDPIDLVEPVEDDPIDLVEPVEEALAAPPDSLEVDQLHRLDDLIDRGELREARDLLAKLAESSPRDHSLRRRAGRLALRSGRNEAAVRLLEACLAHEPDDLRCRLDVCAAHAELEHFEDVVRHARRGLEFPPKDGRLLVHLSAAAFELGAPEEALELATDALRRRPKSETFFHVIRLLALTRRLGPGDAERMRLALEQHPGEPALLFAAGVFEAKHGSRAAALRILRSASERETTARHRRAIEREIADLEASVEEHAA